MHAFASRFALLMALTVSFNMVALAPVTVQAQGQAFVIRYPKWKNGISIDWCWTWATNCGYAVAHQLCRWKGYQRATHYRTYRPGKTYVIGDGKICRGNYCDAYETVTCIR